MIRGPSASAGSMKAFSTQLRALLALSLLSLIWGANWTVMKGVLAYVGPLHFSALRYVFGTGVLFLVLFLRGESLAPTPWRDTLWIGLAQTTGFQTLVQLALLTGGAGKTALLAYTMPFWMIPLAWLLLGERPGRRQWLAIGFAALGLVGILQPWRVRWAGTSALLALSGGLAWAFGTVLTKRLFQRAALSPLRLTAWQMAFGTGGLVLLASLVPERPTDWSMPFVAALAYNGVLSSGLAWAMWLFVVQRVPAHVAGLASLATPLVGVLVAAVMLGEWPDRTEVTGIVCIVLALLGILRNPPRPEGPVAPGPGGNSVIETDRSSGACGADEPRPAHDGRSASAPRQLVEIDVAASQHDSDPSSGEARTPA